MSQSTPFDPDCRACPRLAGFLDDVRAANPDYHARPVAGFGAPEGPLLVVGLAPGMHGANRTGRPFTGDHAGILLYATLHAWGFANQARGDDPADGLELLGARIVNAVRCLPPQNKPTGDEVRRCNPFLRHDIEQLHPGGVIVALGQLAHRAVVRALGLRQAACPFGHGAEHALDEGRALLDSYHCSRYNTQTRRLTPEMFHAVFRRARERIDATADRHG